MKITLTGCLLLACVVAATSASRPAGHLTSEAGKQRIKVFLIALEDNG